MDDATQRHREIDRLLDVEYLTASTSRLARVSTDVLLGNQTLVEPDHPGVTALQAANVAVRGQPAETIYGQGTFDAGGPCALGVPMVMYGASGGVGLLGPDFVTVADLQTEARVLAHLILSELS